MAPRLFGGHSLGLYGAAVASDALSFKDIMREWDVSMNIAFKALRLMRDEGLTEKVNGYHGMVVTWVATGSTS